MKFHNIEHANIENGTGIRVVLWISGCYHKCPGCQNPMTHDPEDGVEFDDKAMDELLEALDHDYIDGLTLSGGDPLCYYKPEVLDIILKVRERFGYTKTIWLYTGFNFEYLLAEASGSDDKSKLYADILLNVDVLVDGKFEQENFFKDYHWAGSTNQRVIDLKRTFVSALGDDVKIVLLEESQKNICTHKYFSDDTFKSNTDDAILKFVESHMDKDNLRKYCNDTGKIITCHVDITPLPHDVVCDC